MTLRNIQMNDKIILLVLTLASALAFVLAITNRVDAASAAVTITVDSAGDTDAADGVCSLREAITAANNNATHQECIHDGTPGTDTIAFAIGALGSRQTITLTANLPTIIEPVVLDGWSQGGGGYKGPPLIELNGENLTSSAARGFRIDGGGTTVRGFVINRFAAPSGAGITLRRADGNWILGNYIGLSADGTAAMPNYYGIWIDNWGNDQPSNDNIIGTNGDGIDDVFEGNVIAGNSSEEIRVETTGNLIAGNFIGTDASGSIALSSNGTGIPLHGDNNVIGTDGDGLSDDLEGNVISGNSVGISIHNSRGHRIAGNIIGLDLDGDTILGNEFNGIECDASATDSDQITIGSNNDGVSDHLEGNVISGNGTRGYSTFSNDCRHITISRNKIGTDVTGTVALGNGSEGLIISAGD